MTQIVKTDAFVIKVNKYGESSKIVTLYTQKFGKINAIAKGARKPKSKFSNCLDILSYVSLIIYKKESTHLHLISDCYLIKSYYKVAENLDKYEVALKIFEIIYKTMHDEEENKKLFSLLQNTMQNLELATNNVKNLYLYFLIKYGEILGYGYNFEKCIKCGYDFVSKNVSEEKIVFDYSRGSPLCHQCESIVIKPQIINLGMLKILNKFNMTEVGLETTTIKITPSSIYEIEKFLFDYLRYHISDLKELKTQRIFKKIK